MALIGTGITITFVTSTISVELLKVSKNGKEVKSIETTHMASTTNAFKPGKCKNPGVIEIEIQKDPDVIIPIGVEQTITFTYPKKVSASASGHISSVSGFVMSEDEEVPLEDKITSKIKIQATGLWTETIEV